MNNEINTREICLQILMDVLEEGVYLHIELRRALDAYSYLERNQKAFIRRLCTGTVEKLMLLDDVLNHYSSVPVNKQKSIIRTILRMSLYQIMFMDSVPESAACNEAVKLAKKHKFSNLSGFVNGVLRNAARGYRTLEFDEFVMYSMPKEAYELIKDQYPSDYKLIFDAFLNHGSKGTMIRLNISRFKEDKDNYLKRIGAEPVCPELNIYRVTGVDGIENIEGFYEGLFNVQDTAAALAVYLSSPEKGDVCLDMCAAPGGKTIQLLDMIEDDGKVVSRDISEAKLYLIENDLKRCCFTNYHLSSADASVPDKNDEAKYDVVIADVPCSGLGIMGTKPDIRYHFTKSGAAELVKLQRRIMENALKAVKPGGKLLYSTCTLNREENEKNVSWLLMKGGCRLEDVTHLVPDIFREYYKNPGILTILPRTGINEGFFIAVIRKDFNDDR